MTQFITEKISKFWSKTEEEWVFAALEFYSAIYEHPITRKFFPGTWDRKKKEIEVNPRFRPRYFLIAMTLVATAGIIPSTYGLSKSILASSTAGVLTYTMRVVTTVNVIVVGLLEWLAIYDVVPAMNGITRLENRLKLYVKPPPRTGFLSKLYNGPALIFIGVLVTFLPPAFFLFLYTKEWSRTVYHQMLWNALGVRELGIAVKLAVSGIYLLIGLFIAHLVGATLCIVCGLSILSLSRLVRSINYLKMVKKSNPVVLFYYRQLLTIIHWAAFAQSIGTSVLMLIGFVLGVAFNYATIKMYGVLEMPFYLIFPAASIIVPVLVRMLLPIAVNCHEDTKGILDDWRKELAWTGGINGQKRKLLLKELRATRPITLYAGVGLFNLFPLKKSTEIDYYKSISDYTINAILA